MLISKWNSGGKRDVIIYPLFFRLDSDGKNDLRLWWFGPNIQMVVDCA